MKTQKFYILKDLPNKCPHAKTKGNEDVSIDICDLNDKICLLESNLSCDIYQEYLDSRQDD